MPPTRNIGRAPPPRGRLSGGKSIGGKSAAGLGKGVGLSRMRRQRKIHRDSVHGISEFFCFFLFVVFLELIIFSFNIAKGDLRRLARRGGVKRISAAIYNEMRGAMTDHLKKVCGLWSFGGNVGNRAIGERLIWFSLDPSFVHHLSRTCQSQDYYSHRCEWES